MNSRQRNTVISAIFTATIMVAVLVTFNANTYHQPEPDTQQAQIAVSLDDKSRDELVNILKQLSNLATKFNIALQYKRTAGAVPSDLASDLADNVEKVYALLGIESETEINPQGEPTEARDNVAVQDSPRYSCNSSFNTNLSRGDSGPQVRALQQFLNSHPDTRLRVPAGNPGSVGNESTYFGSATEDAVNRFQRKYQSSVLTSVNVSSPTGFWGPSSQRQARQLCNEDRLAQRDQTDNASDGDSQNSTDNSSGSNGDDDQDSLLTNNSDSSTNDEDTDDSSGGGGGGSGGDSTDSNQTAPNMPQTVSLNEASRTDTTVTYSAQWSSTENTNSYSWSAGSDNDNWSESGTGVTDTQVTFTAPRSGSDDASFFCVRAVNDAGESEQRCTSFTVPAESEGSESTESPAAPTDLTATPASSSTISLSWTDNSSTESGFDVHRSQTSGFSVGSGNLIDTTDADATSYTDSGLASATTYHYRIVATNSAGTSAPSNEASATTDGETSGGSPDFVEDFSEYGSESELINDSENYYQEESDDGRSRIHLDTGVGVDVDGFALSQSMRYDWPDRTGSSGRCGDFSTGRPLDLREDAVLGSTQTEIWVEYYIRWEDGFTVEAPDSWDCNSASRLKTFFVQQFGAIGRFGHTLTPTQYTLELPNDATSDQGTRSEKYTHNWSDNSWHQYRVEVILPNSPLASAEGGEVRWWVDGELAMEFTGVETDASSIWGLKLGANMNQGPGQEQSNWYGRVGVWTSDPGW